MDDQSKKVICEKCGSPMERVEKQPPKSFAIFSGHTNTPSPSSSPLVTASTSTTITTPYISSQNEAAHRPLSIRVVNYICPSCGWELQKREN